jgi:Zn-dependent protease
MMDIIGLIAWFLILVFSIVIHEVAHGTVANWLGDSTAKYSGRLTLNPLKHLDLVGSFLLPFGLYIISSGGLVFGYAKPVPINPANLRDQKYGSAKVAAAGPVINLILAFLFGLASRLLLSLDFVNPVLQILIFMFGLVALINIMLAVFNLIPLPPLDGSHILFAFLPSTQNDFKVFLQRYGMLILLFLVFFPIKGFNLNFLSNIVNLLFELIVGVESPLKR